MRKKKKKQTLKLDLKPTYQLPNPWHFQQVMKGKQVHKDKTKTIDRKKKYKKVNLGIDN